MAPSIPSTSERVCSRRWRPQTTPPGPNSGALAVEDAAALPQPAGVENLDRVARRRVVANGGGLRGQMNHSGVARGVEAAARWACMTLYAEDGSNMI
jgi:hypothetical protein